MRINEVRIIEVPLYLLSIDDSPLSETIFVMNMQIRRDVTFDCQIIAKLPEKMYCCQWRIDQLHVSNGILIDFIIKRDVTFGSPSCQRKCIAVYGELPIVEFEIPAVPQMKRTLCVRKKI